MKNKKATIITIYDPSPNIGNRLQNYAVQEVLKHFDLDVTTISFQKPILSGKQKIKRLAQLITGYHLPGDKTYWKLFPQRVKSFSHFNRKYIKTQHIKKISQIKPADYYVIGSDQVWNPSWYDDCHLKKDLFLLTFVKDEQKVCFSPSFGIDQLPSKWEPWFKKYLSSIPYISVREGAGSKIVKDLTGKEATVLIDPTMMLDATKWMEIAKPPKKVDLNKPYILTYFLGEVSEQIRSDLGRYSVENDLVVYSLADKNQPDLYITGPSEFIYLVSNAKLIMTDSFHGCVFSFIFQKPFLVYARKGNETNIFSRIDTFLNTFGLQRKYIDSGLDNQLFECDYAVSYRQLTFERNKVLSFLKKSISFDQQEI